ncbi:hypothetical protein [Algicola sagamiensis]|uniref:hypothetical protein n=1 Tax=Algicola sagamiensis TaxID=163869 RepID=UPI00039EBB5C|nr:hypothetical protein [Algicola sagamiensis]
MKFNLLSVSLSLYTFHVSAIVETSIPNDNQPVSFRCTPVDDGPKQGVKSWFEATIEHPFDLNGDQQVLVCLNRHDESCDYHPEDNPHIRQELNLPFKGRIILNDALYYIYDTGNAPRNRFRVQTNIHIRGHQGRWIPINWENSRHRMIDFFNYHINFEKKITTINWSIPRRAGAFGNIRQFSPNQALDWRITFAVEGSPGFQPGTKQYVIELTSGPSSQSAHSYPVLSPLTLSLDGR